MGSNEPSDSSAGSSLTGIVVFSAFGADSYAKPSLLMRRLLSHITIYHYVRGNPDFDFGNLIMLASYTRQNQRSSALNTNKIISAWPIPTSFSCLLANRKRR